MRQISNHPNERESKSMSTSSSIDFGMYARKSVELEARRHGDQMNAIDTVARRLGLGARAVRRMMNGERKTFTPALITRLRQAYLETLQRQLARLQIEIETELAVSGDANADLGILQAEAQALADKIEAAKGAR